MKPGGERGLRAAAPSTVILAAVAVVMPLLALVAPLGLAPLLAVAAVALLAAGGRALVAALRPLAPLAVLLLLLSAWATASAAWSILPLHSFLEGLRLVAISAGGLVAVSAAATLAPRQRVVPGVALALGVLAASLILLIARATDPALTPFDRGVTTLVLALWPALAIAATRRWRVVMGVIVIAASAAALLMVSAAAALALVLSLAAFALAWFAPRLVAAAIAGAVILLAFALPAALPDYRAVVALHQAVPAIKYTGIHRLLIWRFAADRIAERPVLGWGMDASRELPGGHLDFYKLLPEADLAPGSEALPLHPHDAALQWRVELGLPGTVLAVAIILWGLWRVAATPALSRFGRAGALAWATAALVIAMLSYGIWQAWWLSSLWLTAALYACAAAGHQPDEPTSSP